MSIKYTWRLGGPATVWSNGKAYDYENWDYDVSETFYLKCIRCKHSTEAYTLDRFGKIEDVKSNKVMEFMIEHEEAHQTSFKFVSHSMAYRDGHYGNKDRPLKEFKPVRKISINGSIENANRSK